MGWGRANRAWRICGGGRARRGARSTEVGVQGREGVENDGWHLVGVEGLYYTPLKL